MAVGAAQSNQHTVGVPSDAGDSAAKGLLEVLRHPPIILFFKVADGSNSSTTTDGKLCLVGRPAYACGSSVDAKEDEGGSPGAVRGLPDVCVAVLRAGDNLARVGSDIDAGDKLVVATQLVVQGEAGAIGRVQLDRVISSNGERFAVGSEGVVGDWVVEEVMNLGSGHGEWKDRSFSLLSLLYGIERCVWGRTRQSSARARQ